MMNVSRELPHSEYELIKDSTLRQIWEENSASFSSWEYLAIGTAVDEKKKDPEHYFLLSGYRADYSFRHYRKDGIQYIQYRDPAQTNAPYVTRETSLRFSGMNPNEDINIYLSIPGWLRITLNIFLWALMGLVIVLLLFHVIRYPLRMLYNIANGNVFIPENIRIFYRLAWTLLFIGLIPQLISLVVHLILKSRVPPAFSYPVYENLMQSWGLVLAALIAFLFAEAFRKGYELEEEQELTV
jgi:hypothetical protein